MDYSVLDDRLDVKIRGARRIAAYEGVFADLVDTHKTNEESLEFAKKHKIGTESKISRQIKASELRLQFAASAFLRISFDKIMETVNDIQMVLESGILPDSAMEFLDEALCKIAEGLGVLEGPDEDDVEHYHEKLLDDMDIYLGRQKQSLPN